MNKTDFLKYLAAKLEALEARLETVDVIERRKRDDLREISRIYESIKETLDAMTKEAAPASPATPERRRT